MHVKSLKTNPTCPYYGGMFLVQLTHSTRMAGNSNIVPGPHHFWIPCSYHLQRTSITNLCDSEIYVELFSISMDSSSFCGHTAKSEQR